MEMHDLLRELHERADSKIVLLVADGLGGLPVEPNGKTELESARTPNLDALAREGVCGLSIPVLPGITPGSGPGHLALFGYDPLQYRIGRGILEALGINFPVGPRDVAVRGNFCTVDSAGLITDRRAGRPTTERCQAMCRLLQQVRVAGVEVFVEPVREHRFVVVFRGDAAARSEHELGDRLNDTDPQQTGHRPLEAKGADPASQNTARAVNAFVTEAARLLKDQAPTNMVTLRGFARYPKIDTIQELCGLRSVAIAVYPMYRGLARLVGMEVADAGATLGDQVETLRRLWNQYDFFFLHYKYTDSTGEDGNFAAKVEMIEHLDEELPKIRALDPDVLIVTGDHSTPSKLRSHSWHPVPTLLWSPICRPDPVTEFGESYCLHGGLGQFQAKFLLPLALAHAGRLGKFGA
jgi:2,3-bisphosphoglycerate-independent phosphoglycerate mutase